MPDSLATIKSKPSIFVPKYFTQKAIMCFLAVTIICQLLFPANAISPEWWLFNLVAVVGFFEGVNRLSKSWMGVSINTFERKIWLTAFSIRVIWVLFSYGYFWASTGQPFEYEAADAIGYHGEAQWIAGLIKDGKFDTYLKYIGTNYADMGYPLYLGIIATLFDDNILIPRLLKAFWGAFTCVFIYRIAKNNFGESVGRIAGILALALPNLIYYCGLHVKEAEFVFIITAFVYYADKTLTAKNANFKNYAMMALFGSFLFLFRTVSGICGIGSFVIGLIFISTKVPNSARRYIFATVSLVVFYSYFSDKFQHIVNEHLEQSEYNQLSQMYNYSTTSNANKLSKYGSKSIFLPMMLVVPLPSLVDTQQPNANMIAGGVFTRNVYAFFVVVALIALFKRKLIRRHIFLLSFLFSYLIVLGASGFALSERFHMPAIPFLLIFTAYGVSQLNFKVKKYYVPYLLFISLVVIGWNWFKIAGRQ